MRIKPCYEIDFEKEDFTTSGLLKWLKLYELSTERPLGLHQIEWSSPVMTATIDELPEVPFS